MGMLLYQPLDGLGEVRMGIVFNHCFFFFNLLQSGFNVAFITQLSSFLILSSKKYKRLPRFNLVKLIFQNNHLFRDLVLLFQ